MLRLARGKQGVAREFGMAFPHQRQAAKRKHAIFRRHRHKLAPARGKLFDMRARFAAARLAEHGDDLHQSIGRRESRQAAEVHFLRQGRTQRVVAKRHS